MNDKEQIACAVESGAKCLNVRFSSEAVSTHTLTTHTHTHTHTHSLTHTHTHTHTLLCKLANYRKVDKNRKVANYITTLLLV